ncbi:MAG: aminoacyl-histidine dipeptidase [Planctomycetota bacterium]|nr:aminoacyl-histidine dipeptidase [Planctomycetota bacterium]
MTTQTSSSATNPVVRTLKPETLWNHFADLNEIPRPSKKEERVIAFMRSFGESLGLETEVDDVGNVIIRKPASPGMENRIPVVLQSHLDMVCQKNADTEFDFDNQGIEMRVDGDWVAAAGTTLGADNGIGVAAIMSLLSASDIEHPAIEGLFTIDEETGMTGAQGLQGGVLNGRILLNLDTEDDDELTIGCAGGVNVTAVHHYVPVDTPAGTEGYKLAVRGLRGGHSGMDIALGRGNANKIMNRLLWGAASEFGISVAMVDGGGLRNAIPRESFALIAVESDRADEFKAWIELQADLVQSEYCQTDPDLQISVEPLDHSPDQVIPRELQKSLLGCLYCVPNGIYRMSPSIEGLVQTSNNLARVLIKEGEVQIKNLTRSSVESERADLATAIRAVLELTQAEIEISGDYPGWQPEPGAAIVELMSSLYEEMFGEAAHVAACHAGLECGLLGANYPEMQLISFGPNIRGAHSPDEKVQVSSVQKFWSFLLETLKRIPAN